MLGYKFKDINEFPRLKELFEYYKIKPPKLLISPNKALNARSIFFLKSPIQLNKGLIQELKDEEIFAVILHEIGHSKTKALSITITTLSLIYAALLVTGLHLIIYNITQPTILIPSIVFIAITRITLPLAITKISQKIELKCDQYAAKKLGPNKSWLISAFKKIQIKTDKPKDTGKATIYYILFHPYTTHPTFKERIKTIQKQ
ncbi:M48 family metallopeptidase [Methanonatronarchaeum sp. AMET6-2]|uniref:M48 family metallopeptidase n=1 Tax=Methanonatronarchaeum sp. AMET6-2 TaxID=2933293 RepID=UPI00120BEC01|nr:M48 family metalloprotease [Methanonatronarchaeum sp. AMET6-2]RZN62291.1 MAG: hypothetical protein EF811_03130 [Methanonatronarchaeia archaeon]UOY10200.1 M48 family metalloprotease [Methanonatronarchaeum sp. AMET6-2]